MKYDLYACYTHSLAENANKFFEGNVFFFFFILHHQNKLLFKEYTKLAFYPRGILIFVFKKSYITMARQNIQPFEL